MSEIWRRFLTEKVQLRSMMMEGGIVAKRRSWTAVHLSSKFPLKEKTMTAAIMTVVTPAAAAAFGSESSGARMDGPQRRMALQRIRAFKKRLVERNDAVVGDLE